MPGIARHTFYLLWEAGPDSRQVALKLWAGRGQGGAACRWGDLTPNLLHSLLGPDLPWCHLIPSSPSLPVPGQERPSPHFREIAALCSSCSCLPRHWSVITVSRFNDLRGEKLSEAKGGFC
jgi:hypothetical protein